MASGTMTLIVSRLLTRCFDLVLLVVFARLLLPRDFGTVAIALTIVQILEAVLDMPVAQVVVRSSDPSRDLIDTAFTISLLRGLLLMLALAALAWPIALLYGNAALVPVICALGLAPAMRGLTSPALALYARVIDFRRDLLVEFTGKAAGLLAGTIAAFILRDYRAIVVSTIATPIAMMATSFLVAPHRVRLTLRHGRQFYGFLGWFTASQLVSALNWRSNRLVLGMYVPSGALGSFTLAGDLAAVPEQGLIQPMIRPLVAAFARVQDDMERLRALYCNSVATTLAISFPVVIGLAVFADPVVGLVLGAKWSATPPIVTWLALGVCLSALTATYTPLCIALGRATQLFGLNLIQMIVLLPALLLLTARWGVTGAIAAQFLTFAVGAVAVMLRVRALIGASILAQARAIGRVVAGAIVYAALLLAVKHGLHGTPPATLMLLLPIAGGAGLALFWATMLLLWRMAGRPDGLERFVLRLGGRILERSRAKWIRAQA